MNSALEGKWPQYDADEVAVVTNVLHSGKVNYWTGDECRKFEKEFAARCDAEYGIALANGTLALELALEASGIGPGDEVVVTPRSFVASASCVVRVGARPVFADVSPDSQNITPESVSAVITPSTRAVIAVHHAGWPCDMDGLMGLADKNGLLVIEDCAQAHGAMYKGRPVGGIGHIAAFSFCQDKIMTTGGEGGMLVTNDKAIWNRAWSLKDHGKNWTSIYEKEHPPGFRWLHDSIGSNYRMTEMQAAIGRLQLGKLDSWSAKRAYNANLLRKTLTASAAIRVPIPNNDLVHSNYRLYAFVVDANLASGWSRDRIVNELMDRGIPVFTGICPEIYREAAFYGTDAVPKKPLPVAASLGQSSLAFLVHPTLTDADLRKVCVALEAVLGQASNLAPVAQ